MHIHTNISEEKLRDIWHQVPPDYYQKAIKSNILQRTWHVGKLKTVINLIDSNKKDIHKILDVGCAGGWFLSQISKIYPKAACFGIDVYKKALEYGKEQYPNLHLSHADGHKIPFKNNSFDIVICTEVLEHVVNPGEVISEIRRVLAPNGIAIIEMDTGNFLFKTVWYWWTNIRRGVWRDSHIHIFNTEILEKLIKDKGFKIINKVIFNHTMGVAFCLSKGAT